MARRQQVVNQPPTELAPARNAVSLSFALDRRYRLIARLEAAARGDLDKLTEWPGEIRVTSSRPLGFFTGKSAPPLRRDVQVMFDHRLPLRSVYRALQRAWPHLRDQGIVRPTRPLGLRTLALIGHVCIEMPDASWAERHDAWKARHKRWSVKKRQAFIAEFRAAERSFTGEPYGLAYWYDANARLSAVELAKRAREGDRSAQRERERRRARGIESLRSVKGLEVVLHK